MARTAGPLPTDEELDLGPEDEIEDGDEAQDAGDGEGDADDEGEGDDAGDDAGEEEEGGEPRDVTPPRGRARDTIRTLRQRSQEAERRTADLQRQVDELRTSRQPAFDPAAAQRAEAEEIERISMLPPAEQTAAIIEKVRRESRQQAAQIELRNFDRSDISAWSAAKRDDPHARRLDTEVERILNLRRQNGDYSLDRVTIFDALRGKEIRERRATVAPRQRAAARRRVAGQTTRPNRVGGDVSRSGRNERNEDAAREDRLKNIRVGDVF
jgi:hypothetical protein